ncbi:uncharacterized protein LOC114405111 [Glycine soja]|uniref:ATP-dependent DNA helicase pif1 n=1 Tax=Glycine max TaxID=3847 RepID=UPI0003DE8A0A|nr:ATP-dependent DNA helicase pif1 [Glycine max]XP_028223575.1 uncharacterized protein LOC114405111 [Glycine soja]|eukprot:XP_006577600.1 uncharacterized protein LOC100816595 [Glycine max]
MIPDEQASIYNQIVEAVNKDEGDMFFLYGYGGTGKTYIWKTLASSLRADNKIVIMIASSGIASLLLPGGRTAHSKFKIPVPVFEDSTCNIHQGTQLAELLNQTSLIIWDEAPTTHKFCFEALDHSLRDIIKHNSKDSKIFGGKVMVFGEDFWQILPVIPRGSHSDIVNATINSSYLWDHYQILRLTKNVCLQNNMQATNQEETAAFAQWIIDIGDDIIGDENDGYATIEIPQELLITEYNDPIHSIISSTFPDLSHHHNDPEYFQTRAILASTNEIVQQVNDYMLTMIPGNHILRLPAIRQPLILQFKAAFHCDKDAIEIPGFYRRQWLPNYPKIVEFKYDGETYEIQVRQHKGKLYFADGLTRLRTELQIYESVMINFLAYDHPSKFYLHFTPPLDQ